MAHIVVPSASGQQVAPEPPAGTDDVVVGPGWPPVRAPTVHDGTANSAATAAAVSARRGILIGSSTVPAGPEFPDGPVYVRVTLRVGAGMFTRRCSASLPRSSQKPGPATTVTR